MQSGPEGVLGEAEACMRAGRDGEAARLLEAAARDARGEALAAILTTLGTAHSRLGDYGAVERELRTALALRVEALGDDHPDTATTRYNLAESYRHTGRVGEAVALYRQVLETRARDAERAPPALFGIGQCFFTQGDLARAEAAHGKALELRRRVLPAGHEEVAECLLGLASVRTRGSPWRSTSSAACASTRGASPMRSRCSRRRSLSHGRRCPTGTPTSRRCSATCWSAGCSPAPSATRWRCAGRRTRSTTRWWRRCWRSGRARCRWSSASAPSATWT